MDITNCRNCGAPLNENGYCGYCGTTFKRPNIMAIPENQTMDLELRFQKGNEIFILPLRGSISSLGMKTNYYDCSTMDGTEMRYKSSTEVEFEFEGVITDGN